MVSWFWDESIWCPPGLKWSDFKPDSAQFKDLYYSLVTAAALITIRFITELLVFRPIGRYLCSASQPSKVAGDPVVFKHAKNSTVEKFGEGMWRFSFYLTASIFGWYFVLWDKPYFKDTMHCLYDYPHHPVRNEEWLFYNLELGFYISLVLTQIVDTKRKDFWQMFVHHIVTILLIVLSWACNFHRIGVVVMAIHDVSDVPMEGAKLAKYCKKQRLADLLFAIFTLTWIYTRCYLLPSRVIYYTSYKALSIIPFFPAYYIFNGLLCVLQLLNLVWTVLIIRIVFYALQNDGMRDLRSDSEESEELHND